MVFLFESVSRCHLIPSAIFEKKNQDLVILNWMYLFDQRDYQYSKLQVILVKYTVLTQCIFLYKRQANIKQNCNKSDLIFFFINLILGSIEKTNASNDTHDWIHYTISWSNSCSLTSKNYNFGAVIWMIKIFFSFYFSFGEYIRRFPYKMVNCDRLVPSYLWTKLPERKRR